MSAPLTLLRQQHAAFIEWRRERHFSDRTLRTYAHHLEHFADWCEERGVIRAQELTPPMLARYQRYLYLYRKADGQPLSIKGQHTRLAPIRSCLRWLAKSGQLLYNPASDMELPRHPRSLPKQILTAQEVEQILAAIDTTEAVGIRDRAIIETLYSTGIRRMELAALQIGCVEAARGLLIIRWGKGRKDRIVPIGERALKWIERYSNEVRPELLCGPDPGTLFLSLKGGPIKDASMSSHVRKLIERGGVNKTGGCHLFRHTMATLMLENGADVRYIQAILGHSELSSTQIYTRMSIRMICKVHAQTHPADNPDLNHDEQIEDEATEQDILDALEQERIEDKE